MSMHSILMILIEITFFSSAVFLFLICKAKIQSKYLYRDNILLVIASTIITYFILSILPSSAKSLIYAIIPFVVFVLIVLLTLIRFYRNPERRIQAGSEDILAPADGFIAYVKKIEGGRIPFSLKGKNISKLSELTKVNVLETPCWLVGITMTLFDVHYTRAPISGNVVLNQHFTGRFLSLKDAESRVENERNTTVIENDLCQIGVIQIASKRVRDIESFVQTGQIVQPGERIGRIKFGSQTDILFPVNSVLKIRVGEWVYGGKTIIANMILDI